MADIILPENENINEAIVVQEDGSRNSALMTANVGTTNLILPDKENVDEAVYVDDNGKRHKVKMVATIYGGGSSDSHNKGWFATPTALRTAYPEAEDGDYAIVGSTDTVWVWDGDSSDWADSGSTGAVDSVNGQTGTVVLDGTDINAVVDEESDTIEGHLQSLKGGIDLISDEVDTKITNPTGGTAGQYLKKTASGEEWADVEAGSSKVVITLTGESGTLTSEQIAQVLDDTAVLEIVCDGQVFRLSNKQSSLSYRTYINIDTALSSGTNVKAIYIQLNSSAANYGSCQKKTNQLVAKQYLRSGNMAELRIGTTKVTPVIIKEVESPLPAEYVKLSVVNGKLTKGDTRTSFVLPSNITDIDSFIYSHGFPNNTNFTSVDLSSLTTISGDSACSYMFDTCTNLTSVNLSSLTTISEKNACYYMFNICRNLTSVDLSSLTTISGDNACIFMFNGCTSLTSVDLSSLTSITGSSCLQRCFSSCSRLSTVRIGGTTPIDFGTNKNQLQYLFQYCSNRDGIDLYIATDEETLSTLSGYPTFGAPSSAPVRIHYTAQ